MTSFRYFVFLFIRNTAKRFDWLKNYFKKVPCGTFWGWRYPTYLWEFIYFTSLSILRQFISKWLLQKSTDFIYTSEKVGHSKMFHMCIVYVNEYWLIKVILNLGQPVLQNCFSSWSDIYNFCQHHDRRAYREHCKYS